ncbi:MAG TPA: tRNA (N(6)-L-threonylcarbamoyladenosine(37)-C(2))-methylthiotransferase MtaB [Candidatus Deferrimicrobiaceae bacterium]
MRRRLAVVTVGCKTNFADSAGIVALAARKGFSVVPPGDPADVLVVNSCTVTHRADRDSRALARRLRRENPGAAIVFTGCYAESSPGERERLPEVDHWVGIRDPARLGELLSRLAGPEPAPACDIPEYAADRLLGHNRTFLKIQDGCDASCAYCIVPLARGPGRSLPAGDVIDRAVRAERDGARELVLTGIHAGRYGDDRGERDGLAALLSTLLSATSACRFRLGSVETPEITPRLVGLLASGDRVCPHLHVPLQSGSDRVLRRMRRPYTARQFRDVLGRLAAAVPGIRLGADVIAGFPGETADDFEETARVIRATPVSYLHAFPYSPRAGTESARWADDVPVAEKKVRVARLREMDATLRKGFLAAQVGRRLTAVAETRDPATGEFRGTTENYADVGFRADGLRVGELCPVRVLSVDGNRLMGRGEHAAVGA